MRALITIGPLAALVLLLGCPDENTCEGEAPYASVCTCPGDGGDAVAGHVDLDLDGFGGEETGWFCGGGYASNGDDCDDEDAAQNPGDRDGDGISSCGGPSGEPDCDDGDAATYPGADELCDGVDNDCDGATTGEEDADGDGYRLCDGDCDDEDADVTPGDEDGDGASGCDDPPDCDDTDAALNVDDHDGDGASTCDGDCDDADPALNLDDLDGDGSTTCDGDCDDHDPLLEGLDADGDGDTTCDGDCDDGDPDLDLADADGDGYSTCDGDCHDNNTSLHPGDDDGDGISSCDGDCDDGEATVYPGAEEVCDGLDNDCDPKTDELVDQDGDGFSACDDDCDDTDPTVFADAAVTSGWVRACPRWLDADLTGAEWWFHRVEQPSVVFDGVDHVAYYRTGYGLDEMGFGALQSSDGVTWQRVANGPLFTGTGDVADWDGEGVGSPRLIYDPADVTNPYKLYYAARSDLTGESNIGLATSGDWQTWVRQGIVVPAGAAGELDEDHAESPYVWIDGATYHMVYVCRGATDHGLCLASSTDQGYTWTKWDPEPGVGFDPEPLVLTGDPGAWDDDAIASPVWIGRGGAETLLYAGRSTGEYAAGVASAPFGPGERVTKLDDLAPVLAASTMAGRWDDLTVQPGEWIEDGGVVTLLYGGATEDLAFDGGEIVQIGAATNEPPTLTVTQPVSDPHVFATGDPVVFAGTAGDSQALDELTVVIESHADEAVLLTTVADAAGDWTVTAPSGTFVDAPAPYLVTVTVVDAGGLAAATSISFDVSP